MLTKFEHFKEYILECDGDVFFCEDEIEVIDETKGTKTVKKYIQKGPMNIKNRSQFKELLSKYIVTFKFIKRGSKPGEEEERKAVGTTNLDLIPKSQHPTGSRVPPNHQVCFWDMEKEHWRSLRSFKFIKLIKVEKP